MEAVKLGTDGKPVSLVQYDEPVCLGDETTAASMIETKVPFTATTKVMHALISRSIYFHSLYTTALSLF